MFKWLSLIFILCLSACGWQFKNSELLPAELRVLSFDSADPYSDMSRVLREQMELNGIQTVAKSDGVANIRLNAVASDARVVSVFKQAREAEKVLSLTVNATVTIPNKGSYPVETSVYRTFFDDSRAALAKSNESESIMKQMYQQASWQLLIKISSVYKTLAVSPEKQSVK
ncbi:LPS-assembly lipoprotein [Nicoletella semolina]|uniref:LPS-assembly lipoprotein LptE n=1 Tax=Nicoletella semolina TaxID=271160 RepID=A0A4R2N9T5_9PAST|nr:LPS assembly lipoprotein LptE [Nicoletella semolina]MDH2925332.1 hypothetical protein [Nicoletella semolina]TCP17809.1 LPS-assembly lipoprotein [Nicoletella semolina]